jgi:histidine triad (HIT) family protein
MVELTQDIKKQLEEQKKQCIFCKIISKEMQSKIVYEDDLIIGMLDINPGVNGHMLLMQKEHYPIMPFIPKETFVHLFGSLSLISKALKEAMLCTGINIMVANGGLAGQRANHFLIHLIPREKQDNIDKYNFSKNSKSQEYEIKQVNEFLSKNLNIMMSNHFKRNPANWLSNQLNDPNFITQIKSNSTLIYQDPKATCVSYNNSICPGHFVIYSNEEEKYIENISFESMAHLFFLASFAATASFEGLKAQATNIILKSGVSDDNLDGKFQIHIIPRYPEDNLDFLLEPMQNKSNLDEIQNKIKDKMFYAEHNIKKIKENFNQNNSNNDINNPNSNIVNNNINPNSINDSINNVLNQKNISKEEQIKNAINLIKRI